MLTEGRRAPLNQAAKWALDCERPAGVDLLRLSAGGCGSSGRSSREVFRAAGRTRFFHERLETLDVLRGFALLGILAMNTESGQLPQDTCMGYTIG